MLLLLMLLLVLVVVVKFSLVNTLGSRRGTIGWDCPGGSIKTKYIQLRLIPSERGPKCVYAMRNFVRASVFAHCACVPLYCMQVQVPMQMAHLHMDMLLPFSFFSFTSSLFLLFCCPFLHSQQIQGGREEKCTGSLSLSLSRSPTHPTLPTLPSLYPFNLALFFLPFIHFDWVPTRPSQVHNPLVLCRMRHAI